MEVNNSYYENMFDDFVRQCPFWAKDVAGYRPKHVNAIRITLRNGDCVDYNGQTGSYHYRDRDALIEFTPNDVTDENCREEFSANLAEMMNRRGVGQAILAERTGLSTAIISKYLRRKSTPSITNLKKIARALDCHLDELLD